MEENSHNDIIVERIRDSVRISNVSKELMSEIIVPAITKQNHTSNH